MVTTIRKYTGGAHPFLEFACLSTDTKPVDLVPDNSICHEIDTGKKYYIAGGVWHEAPPRGGASGGGSLPANFPTEGAENANKYAGFDENGNYTAKDAPSGGGAEKFIVTLTETDDTWTADKTIAEIVAADEAGKNVVASFQYMGQLPTELPKVSWIRDPEGTASLFMFSGIVYEESEEVAVIVGQQDEGSDVWQVIETPVPTSTNEPLIVTLTADGSTGNFVGDKTNGEVYSALSAGQAVILSATVGSNTFKLAVQYAAFDGTDYEFAFIDSTSVKNTVVGGANDYVTASLA